MANKILDAEEKRLTKLSGKALIQYLMQLSAKERLDSILSRADTNAIVGAMAEQDFYFTVKELGPDDALPLLSHARVGQLNHLFDLEWWHKDEIKAGKAVDWLDKLSKGNREKLLEWLYQADFELLVLLLKKWITVVQIPEDIDPVEATDKLPSNTLDDQYFWETRYPQYEDFIRDLLSLIFEANYGFYKELMNHVLWATNAEVEESAYRFHRGRLEDHAIPDFYDAIEIYHSIGVNEFSKRKQLIPEEVSSPVFAVSVIPEGALLKTASREIDDIRLLDTLQWEIASLANKVIVADQLSLDNPEALHRAVDKAAAYTDIGLQVMSRRGTSVPRQLLRDVFLEHLFRIGQEEVAHLKLRMVRETEQGWISRWPWGMRILDPMWMESAELLLARTPKLMRKGGRSGDQKEDIFRSEDDLAKGAHLLDIIEAVGVLFSTLEVSLEEHSELDLWDMGQIHTPEEITLGSLVWTATAQFILYNHRVVAPIPVEVWPKLFPHLSPVNFGKSIISWARAVQPKRNQSSLIEEYLEPLLIEYREEMAPFVSADRIPDPSLVKYFLFKA